MNDLHHLTLNTGHVAMQPRAAVGQDAIDRLLPVLDAEGGPVPGMEGWHLDFFFPLRADGRRLDGGAFFQIADEPGTSKRPVVMAVACWREALSADAWGQARQGYEPLRPALLPVKLWREMPFDPPPVPWLAVWLTPFVAVADVTDLRAFGGLERCVAFALMESS